MAATNTDSNTPSPEDRARMKAEHKIGWHPAGGWCRKFPGDANRTYFGKVGTAEAIRRHNAEEDRRAAGEAGAVRLTNLRVRDAVNLFLTHLDQQHASGKISAEQRGSYGQEVDIFIKAVGKNRRLADFCQLSAPGELFAPLRTAAVKRGLSAAEKHVVQIRTFLDWCANTRRFIPAPFYADEFSAPSRKEKLRDKKTRVRKTGEATWTPAEVRQIIDAAKATSVHRYAQVLLMVNGGMGATDLANLEVADVDWDRQCIHTDRSKTLVPRVVPLWNVTRQAMEASQAARPRPADPRWASRFFLTPKGKPIVTTEIDKNRRGVKRYDVLRNWFYQLLSGEPAKRKAVIRLPHLRRHGAGGYTLRSFFATQSLGQPPDLVAVILGHAFNSKIMEWYIRGDLLDRLRVVSEHVHQRIPDQ